MMSKAEDLAEKAYPQEMDGYCENNAAMRVGFKIGYHQAEKDMELSWEDMMLIHKYIKDAMNFKLYRMLDGIEGQKEVYQEVLRRFTEQRKEK